MHASFQYHIHKRKRDYKPRATLLYRHLVAQVLVLE
jgi:hypothetical protein